MGMGRADPDALAACYAARGEILEFLIRMAAFGVVAPETLHGAPFQEHGCPYPRAVMDRKALDMKDKISAHSCCDSGESADAG